MTSPSKGCFHFWITHTEQKMFLNNNTIEMVNNHIKKAFLNGFFDIYKSYKMDLNWVFP